MAMLSTFCSLDPHQQERIREGIWPLPERERSVLEMRLGIFCLAHTYNEIAAKFGCSPQLVVELESRALHYLLHSSSIDDLIRTLFPDDACIG